MPIAAAHAGLKPRLRVMIVDDAEVVRGLFARWIAAEPDFEVVASLRTGRDAVRELENADPDVVVLDVEMPELDGISALPKLLALRPGLVVIMASTLTRRNAEISLRALSLGAADYIPKPSAGRSDEPAGNFRRELIDGFAAVAQRCDGLQIRLFVDPARNKAAHHNRVINNHNANWIERGKRRGRRKGSDNTHTHTRKGAQTQQKEGSTSVASDQPDLLKLGFDDLLVEGLHDVFVRAGAERACDMRHIVLGGAEHDLRPIAARQATQRLEEVVSVHHRHVPVEQHRIRQCATALLERLLSVLGLDDLEIETLENPTRHLSDDARIIDHQTGLHWSTTFSKPATAAPAYATLEATPPSARRRY